MTLLIRYAITLSMLVIASPLFANDWKTRPTDNRLDQTDLSRLITGQTLTFHDGALSVFHTDGRYAYTYGDGERGSGTTGSKRMAQPASPS